MYKIYQLIDKYHKYFMWFFIPLWIFFIVKLWWFWMDVNTHCWGGAINFCFWIDYEYYWTNAWTLAFFLMFVVMFLILFISDSNNNISKVKFAFLIFVLWILSKSFFYLISPDFRFYEYWIKYYSNSKWEITNMNLYLKMMKKYCDNSIDDFNFKGLKRESMCWWEYISVFNTVQEYVTVLDFLNKNNLWYLYNLTYLSAENIFWIERIIPEYRDPTFYWYVIDKHWTNQKILLAIKNNTDNNDILEIIDFVQKSYSNGRLLFGDSYKEFWEQFNKDLDIKIKEISEINYNIF